MSQFLYPSACVIRPLAPAAASTSTLTGDAVDCRDLDGPLMCVLSAGAGSGTAPTLNAKIQHSADGSTGWADLAGATFAEITDTAGTQKIVFPKTSTNGYVRLIGTIAGDTPSFAISALLIAMRKIA